MIYLNRIMQEIYAPGPGGMARGTSPLRFESYILLYKGRPKHVYAFRLGLEAATMLLMTRYAHTSCY